MDNTILASCTCGNFQFKSTRAPILQLTCHCQDCRDVAKQPSTNFAFFKLTEAEVQGATVLHHFVADSGAKTLRETCASCGDALLDRTEGFPKIVGVVAERIQPPYGFQARCHVWAASKTTDAHIPEGMQTFARSMA